MLEEEEEIVEVKLMQEMVILQQEIY